MPAQPQVMNSPPPADDHRNPRKRQIRLDDNGEPVALPVSKKRKSAADQNTLKKKLPAKTRAKKKSVSKTVSVTNDSEDTRYTPNVPDETPSDPQEPSEPIIVTSSDDEEVEKKHEEPEEDDEAELGLLVSARK